MYTFIPQFATVDNHKVFPKGDHHIGQVLRLESHMLVQALAKIEAGGVPKSSCHEI